MATATSGLPTTERLDLTADRPVTSTSILRSTRPGLRTFAYVLGVLAVIIAALVALRLRM